MEELKVEIVLGCRTGTGLQDSNWGIDWYGNDRLFYEYDQKTFATWLPAGNSAKYIRGLVNINGANALIPWDTHKRHLNSDRDIVHILTTHPLLRQAFQNWANVYGSLSGDKELRKTVKKAYGSFFPEGASDFKVAHSVTVEVDPSRKRTSSKNPIELPKDTFVPKVPIAQKRKVKETRIPIRLTREEIEILSDRFRIDENLSQADMKRQLGQAIKDEILASAPILGSKRRRTKSKGK